MKHGMDTAGGSGGSWHLGVAAVGLLLLAMVARIAGPSDIEEYAQPAPIDHIVDIASNGSWLMQQDSTGRLASKPPMYPWLGALGVKATGAMSEWSFKLPSLAAFVLVTALTFDLARRGLGVTGGWLAVTFWVANAAAFKLMYVARPDMLLALWIVSGIWCVQWLRPRWRDAMRRPSGREALAVAGLWLAVAAGMLTKGPPGLIPAVWLALAVLWDGAWRRFGWRGHAAGLTAAVALLLAWLTPTLMSHPDYVEVMRYEVYDRITGTGSGASRSTPRLAGPGYFLARFAPWSLLLLTTAALMQWRRPGAEPQEVDRVAWTVPCVGVIVGLFMLSRGLRADYLLPAYPIAAAGAAAMVLLAQRRRGPGRVVVHLVMGAMALVAIVLAVVGPMVHRAPQPLTFAADGVSVTVGRGYALLMWLSAAICLGTAVAALAWTHRRRYVPAALATAFALTAIISLHQLATSRTAVFRAGDRLLGMVELADALAQRHDAPVVVYNPGRVPMQAMLGRVQPDPEHALELTEHGAILLTSRSNWQAVIDRFADRARALASSPTGREYRSDEEPDQWLLLHIGPERDDDTLDTAGRIHDHDPFSDPS